MKIIYPSKKPKNALHPSFLKNIKAYLEFYISSSCPSCGFLGQNEELCIVNGYFEIWASKSLQRESGNISITVSLLSSIWITCWWLLFRHRNSHKCRQRTGPLSYLILHIMVPFSSEEFWSIAQFCIIRWLWRRQPKGHYMQHRHNLFPYKFLQHIHLLFFFS